MGTTLVLYQWCFIATAPASYSHMALGAANYMFGHIIKIEFMLICKINAYVSKWLNWQIFETGHFQIFLSFVVKQRRLRGRKWAHAFRYEGNKIGFILERAFYYNLYQHAKTRYLEGRIVGNRRTIDFALRFNSRWKVPRHERRTGNLGVFTSWFPGPARLLSRGLQRAWHWEWIRWCTYWADCWRPIELHITWFVYWFWYRRRKVRWQQEGILWKRIGCM